MENHPIPQDVTGFQFKLIGNMTVKQFAFVAAGIVTAAILYYAPNPSSALIITALKVIFIPLTALGGLFVAFIPIEGRPVDIMFLNFLKAIFSPNQYIYQKTGRHFAVTTLQIHAVQKQNTVIEGSSQQAIRIREQQLQAYLASASHRPKNSVDERESQFLNAVTATPQVSSPQPMLQQAYQPTVQPLITPSPMPQAPISPNPEEQIAIVAPSEEDQHGAHLASPDLTPEQKESELENKEHQLQGEIAASQQAETTQGASPQATYVAHLHTIDLQKQLQDVLTQKQQLEQELLQLKNQLSLQKELPAQPQPQPFPQPQPSTAQVPPPEQHVRKIPLNAGKAIGLPNTPDVANLIVGIIKDPRGNVLNNILIEVKDKQGSPVRAFKSNPLGQFASATQLPSGTYTIEFEDPKGEHRFDVIEITLKGEIVEPIEVISHDAREELRKALFN